MRQKAYINFYTNSIFVLEDLEVTAHSHRKNEISGMFTDVLDLSPKARASSICKRICILNSLILRLCLYKLLVHLSENTTKTQGPATDILQAFNEKTFQGNVKITKV